MSYKEIYTTIFQKDYFLKFFGRHLTSESRLGSSSTITNRSHIFTRVKESKDLRHRELSSFKNIKSVSTQRATAGAVVKRGHSQLDDSPKKQSQNASKASPVKDPPKMRPRRFDTDDNDDDEWDGNMAYGMDANDSEDFLAGRGYPSLESSSWAKNLNQSFLQQRENNMEDDNDEWNGDMDVNDSEDFSTDRGYLESSRSQYPQATLDDSPLQDPLKMRSHLESPKKSFVEAFVEECSTDPIPSEISHSFFKLSTKVDDDSLKNENKFSSGFFFPFKKGKKIVPVNVSPEDINHYLAGSLTCSEENIENIIDLKEEIRSKMTAVAAKKKLHDLDDSFFYTEDRSKVYGILGYIYFVIYKQ